MNPGAAIPPQITVLTGITDSMVLPAPMPEDVLPTFLEFVGDAVIVGHNVRYDLGFLDAALEAQRLPPLSNRWVDTCALARRLVADEVPNCRLGTLASRMRLPHQPCHRALDDALATGDLLHLLLERAARLGVTGLDDLLGLPTIAGHPQVGKLRLTDGLPPLPGVYLFRDRQGRVLYVGKARNLRTRVRSYFSGDERRKVGQLLREVRAHRPSGVQRRPGGRCARGPAHPRPLSPVQPPGHPLAEVRLPEADHRRAVPPAVGGADRPARRPALYLGPLPSTRTALRVAEAIQTAVPIRRCTGRPGSRSARCVAAQIGVALCPCDGTLSEVEYQVVVERLRRALTIDPSFLFAVLGQRIGALATAQRFEEAADVRDRAAALAQALRRQRRMDGLRRAGRVLIDLPSGGGAELAGGRLLRCWGPDGSVPLAGLAGADDDPPTRPWTSRPNPTCPAWARRSHPRARRGRRAHVHRRVARAGGAGLRLARCDRGLAEPYPPLPSFEPAAAGVGRRGSLGRDGRAGDPRRAARRSCSAASPCWSRCCWCARSTAATG